jgi:hypothetical protein
MICSKAKPAPCRSTAVVAYTLASGKPVARCADHPIDASDPKVSRSGEPCSFCQRGFIQRLAHIDKGRCYRCNGTGIWPGSERKEA